ncbi:uncharacterized protein [Nicotiana tomentosiformis]|uniref:uncharacterized protein n=1 Tax=Nicotiana tomentosiformis TaxID=4098 RepID=UPI00388C7330
MRSSNIPSEYEDFAFCVNSCGLFDIGYNGSPFIWWNGRPNDQCIFKWLDRIFVNLSYQNLLPNLEVQHLIRTGSDHAPLLRSFGQEAMKFVKHFKFLNFWSTHDTVKEILFEEEPTIQNRIVLQRAQAELKKYLSIEEQYWKQKAGLNWFAEGDRNTRLFHNHVNGKRQKVKLKRIQNEDGN